MCMYPVFLPPCQHWSLPPLNPCHKLPPHLACLQPIGLHSFLKPRPMGFLTLCPSLLSPFLNRLSYPTPSPFPKSLPWNHPAFHWTLNLGPSQTLSYRWL